MQQELNIFLKYLIKHTLQLIFMCDNLTALSYKVLYAT